MTFIFNNYHIQERKNELDEAKAIYEKNLKKMA